MTASLPKSRLPKEFNVYQKSPLIFSSFSRGPSEADIDESELDLEEGAGSGFQLFPSKVPFSRADALFLTGVFESMMTKLKEKRNLRKEPPKSNTRPINNAKPSNEKDKATLGVDFGATREKRAVSESFDFLMDNDNLKQLDTMNSHDAFSLLSEEHEVVDTVFVELIRQVGSHCLERGLLLNKVRLWLRGIFERSVFVAVDLCLKSNC